MFSENYFRMPLIKVRCKSLFQREQYHAFNMMRMWKHINRLYFFNLVFFPQQINVPGQCGRITTHIYNFGCSNFESFDHQFFVHACPRRISNDHIGPAMVSKNSSLQILITSPAKKSACAMLLIAAFFFASLIASSITSTPMIFFCKRAYKNADTAGTAIKIIHNFLPG